MTQVAVRSEVEEKRSLVVVYGGGKLGLTLVRDLRKQELSVVHIAREEQVLPVLSRPTYVVFFLSGEAHERRQFPEALEAAKSNKAKVVVIRESAADREFWRKNLAKFEIKPVLVEIRGKVSEDRLGEVAERIVKFIFTANLGSENLILAKEDGKDPDLEGFPKLLASSGRQLSIEEVYGRLRKYSGGRLRRALREAYKEISALFTRRLLLFSLPLLILLALFFPVMASSYHAFLGWRKVADARSDLVSGKLFMVEGDADAAVSEFAAGSYELRRFSGTASFLGLSSLNEKGFEVLAVSERAAAVLRRVGKVAPVFSDLTKGLLTGGGNLDLLAITSKIRLELGPIRDEIGSVRAQSSALLQGRLGYVANLFVPANQVASYQEDMISLGELLSQADRFLAILPQILGEEPSGRVTKKYLVIFQNSAELRPTGGFIGSYAIVTVANGKAEFKINDIYAADGQLRGHINPPDEILHFLGQPSWFMRDANFAADFPLTAGRLMWFLEKETGERVDGVVAVDYGLVQKLLAVTGPITVPGYEGKVTAENFFEKAEYQAEINFFAGSTQKRDYLGAVATVIVNKLMGETSKDFLALGRAFYQALLQKNILLYFSDPDVESAMTVNEWDGSIARLGCLTPSNNCLALVEANFGANKANYFVNRMMKVQAVLDKAGGMETTAAVTLSNDSPSTSWPGGDYKDYLRFLVPGGSTFVAMDLGDSRIATVSPVLTADVLSRVTPSQFLVYKSFEVALGGGLSTLGSFDSYGALLVVPVGSSRTVTFKYKPGFRVGYGSASPKFNFTVLKQPGTSADPLDFALDYPSFLQPRLGSKKSYSLGTLAPLVFTQRLIYNTDLSIDRTFEVSFDRQN